MLKEAEYALYRVRRIYPAPGRADRAVERLVTGSHCEMINRFEQISSSLDVRVEHDIRYGYVRERQQGRYPAHEEFFVVGLAVEAKKAISQCSGKLIRIFLHLIVLEVDLQFPGDEQSFVALDRIQREFVKAEGDLFPYPAFGILAIALLQGCQLLTR